MTDQEQEPWQEPWPEKMYLLHPSIKTFGAMVSNPERREYVRADRIEELVKERDEAQALQSCACNYDTPTDVCMGHHALFERLYAAERAKLEAKLTKAVEVLRFYTHDYVFSGAKARAALAELEGK